MSKTMSNETKRDVFDETVKRLYDAICIVAWRAWRRGVI